MLISAMLLVSTSVRAQISEAELQKADVNGDGCIDVADLNGIICIMNELGDPNGEYRYFLGEVAAEDAENQEYLESLIQNSSSTFKGKPSKITLPEYSDDNSIVIWIYDETMGYPAVTHNGFGTGDGDADDVGIVLPKGYKMKYWSNGGFQVDIRWLAAYNSEFINSGIQYDDGDVNKDGQVNSLDINTVISMMPNSAQLEGVKYAICFLSYEHDLELDKMGVEAYTQWMEEQIANSKLTYTHRPSNLYFPNNPEKGSYIWLYPTSLGTVDRITDFSRAGVGALTSTDVGITPPAGYDFWTRESESRPFKFDIIWK